MLSHHGLYPNPNSFVSASFSSWLGSLLLPRFVIVRFEEVMYFGLVVDDDVHVKFCGSIGDDRPAIAILEVDDDDDAEDDAWIGASGLCFFSEESGSYSRGLF
jgi:hypothetical protein